MKPKIKEVTVVIPYTDIGKYAKDIVSETFPDSLIEIVNVTTDDDNEVSFTFEIFDRPDALEIIEAEIEEGEDD